MGWVWLVDGESAIWGGVLIIPLLGPSEPLGVNCQMVNPVFWLVCLVVSLFACLFHCLREAIKRKPRQKWGGVPNFETYLTSEVPGPAVYALIASCK